MHDALFSEGRDNIHSQERGAGFENPDHELLPLWIVAPTGLGDFFRDTFSPPGAPPKQLTREPVNEIARKYATEFR
jgi:hypothetical protein